MHTQSLLGAAASAPTPRDALSPATPAFRAAGVLGALVGLVGCGYPCTEHDFANGATGEITSIESVVTAQKRREIEATCQATLAAIEGDASAAAAGDAGADSTGPVEAGDAGPDSIVPVDVSDAGAAASASDDAGGSDRIVGQWRPWISLGLPCQWSEGCVLVGTNQPYEAFVRMVRPKSPGTYSLAQLQGEICERFRNGPPKLCYGWTAPNGEQTDWHCAAIDGRLTVRKIAPPCSATEDRDSNGIACGRLDADLLLAGSIDPAVSPEVSAEGNVSLLYGDTTYQTTCGGGDSFLYNDLP